MAKLDGDIVVILAPDTSVVGSPTSKVLDVPNTSSTLEFKVKLFSETNIVSIFEPDTFTTGGPTCKIVFVPILFISSTLEFKVKISCELSIVSIFEPDTSVTSPTDKISFVPVT